MELPILSAAALGLALLSAAPESGAESATDLAAAGDEAATTADLVGARLYATDEHIPRWGEPVRADDVALRDLGRVGGVLTAPDGAARGLVVAVGGLWGLGAQEVEVGLDRVRFVPDADGETRLVVDLSAAGAASSFAGGTGGATVGASVGAGA